MRIRVDRKARDGFTIVEIMITIAILGILVVLAVGNFEGMNEKYKVEAETKQFYADLMDARGRAMQRNRWFFVQVSSTGYATYEDRPLPDGDGGFDNTADAMVTRVAVRHTISTDPCRRERRSDSTGTESRTTTGPSISCRPRNRTTTASRSCRRGSRWGSTCRGELR